MPLGTAKDSIADLQSLIRSEAGKEEDYTRAPAAVIVPGPDEHEINTHEDGDSNDDFLIAAEEETETELDLPSVSMPMPLHEAVVTTSGMEMPINHQRTSPSRRRSPKSYDNVMKETTTTYSGYDYTDYYSESYGSYDSMGIPPKKKNNNVLTCLFPFLHNPLDSDSDDDNDDDNAEYPDSTAHTDEHSNAPSVTISEGSSASVAGSDVGDLESSSVHYTRDSVDVRKAQGKKQLTATGTDPANHTATSTSPTSTNPTPSTSASTSPEPDSESESEKNHKPSSSNDLNTKTKTKTNTDVKKELKGILKHTVTRPQAPIIKSTESLQKALIKNSQRGNLDTNQSQRRSILPTYSNDSYHLNGKAIGGNNHTNSDDVDKNKGKKAVTFSSMARVLPVIARNDMSFYTKSLIWWQRNDYDDFKKAGRIIAKAMLQGGSEIWLQTSNAWGKKQSNRSTSGNVAGGNGNGMKNYNAEYLSALQKYGVKIEDDDDEEEKNEDENDALNEKWWCKFGHSRRGLEHIVSIQEGRQRQKLVNSSIQSVLEEQRRQRISSRKDSHKIAAICMQYTSWAKDLALAAGEADAEAVRKNFHSKAKGRLAYLSTKLLSRGKASVNDGRPGGGPSASLILSANPALTAGLLDSHTHDAKLLLKQQKEKRKELEQRAAAVMKNDTSIAHQAAGFQFQETVV